MFWRAEHPVYITLGVLKADVEVKTGGALVGDVVGVAKVVDPTLVSVHQLPHKVVHIVDARLHSLRVKRVVQIWDPVDLLFVVVLVLRRELLHEVV